MSAPQSTSSRNSLPILGLILAILGLGISIYALNHHLDLKQTGQTDALCNVNDTFSCDSVANSQFSEDPWGNPLGLYGIGYFLGLMLLLLVGKVKEEHRNDAMSTYGAMVALGVLVSISLFLISHFYIGAFCLACIGVYSVTIMQALVTWFLREELPKGWTIKGLYNGGFYMLTALIGCLLLYQFMEPAPSRNFTPDTPKTAEDVQNMIRNLKGPEIKIDRSAYSGLGEDYRKGGDNAKVTIVEFADFQCPACQAASQTLAQLHKEFGNQILVVFKNYPLDGSCNDNMGGGGHEHACMAATVARCAGQLGKFWPMHDKIFSEQQKIDANRLKLWALEMGIGQEQLDECLRSPDILAKIKGDIGQGSQLNIQGTPAIFINGIPVAARSYGYLREQIMLRLAQ